VLEAMKMEHALLAQGDGVVVEIAVEPGAQVSEGARLLVIEASEAG
jgi:3-methylcrotonyl-CoA carboxylase alpha subunit